MMMMDVYKLCHCGAKIRGKMKAPKIVSFIFAGYLNIIDGKSALRN
jgi:hypothetical protein